MKNSKLKALVNMSKLPNLAGDMISLDSEMIRTVKGGIGLTTAFNLVCTVNTGCGKTEVEIK